MDKPDFDNGVAGPPTKRLKISIETPSTITTTQPVKPAKMDDRKTRLAIVDSGFQPERESQVGILCFVNDANPGFSGTLKQRYVSGCYCLSPFILEACSVQSLLLDVILLSYDVGAKMGWVLFLTLGWMPSPSSLPTWDSIFKHHSFNLSSNNSTTCSC